MGMNWYRAGMLIGERKSWRLSLATLKMDSKTLNANAISNNAGSFYNRMATSKSKSAKPCTPSRKVSQFRNTRFALAA